MNYRLSGCLSLSLFTWRGGFSRGINFRNRGSERLNIWKKPAKQRVPMTSIEGLIGLVVIGLAIAFMIVFSVQDRKSKIPLRRIPAMEHLSRMVGLAVEEGRRIHISFGRGNFLDSHAASTLTNTALLKEVLKQSAGSDRPPAITSGDGTTTLLAIDVLYSTRRAGIIGDRVDSRRGRLSGVTPLSYAAGMLPSLHQEQTSMMVTGGTLGAELNLILDTADDESIHILTASDSPVGQAVAFSSPGDVLLGEEIFALPAYMNAGSMYPASLLAEDSLRWLLIVFIILGAILRSIGLTIL